MKKQKPKKQKVREKKAPPPLKLDFGCGKNVREGFEGVDERPFGQAHVLNLVATRKPQPDYFPLLAPTPERLKLFEPWPWKDESVEEAHASHFIEHLTPIQRVHFVNELFRVLKPGAKCMVIVPSGFSGRAYGDLTHQWPAVHEFWFHYLVKEWRENNAPHDDFYTCNFITTWGHSLHPELNGKNSDFVNEALKWRKEAAQDVIGTMTKG